MGTYSVKENAPKGWVPLAPHSTEFRQLTAYTDEETGEPDVARKRLYVMPHVEKGLRPVTDPTTWGKFPCSPDAAVPDLAEGHPVGTLDVHAYTENWMGNVEHWGRAAGTRRCGRTGTARRSGRRSEPFVSDGGTTDIQGKTVEAYKSLQPGSIPTWTESGAAGAADSPVGHGG